LAEAEEGEVKGEELTLATTSVGRMSFGKPPAVKQVIYQYTMCHVFAISLQQACPSLFIEYTNID